MNLNWYEVLGLPRTATTEQIVERHRLLARRYHPDKAGDDDPWPARIMPLINQAASTLSDPVRRAEYDARLELPPPPKVSPHVAPKEPPHPQPRQVPPPQRQAPPVKGVIETLFSSRMLDIAERGIDLIRKLRGDDPKKGGDN